MSRKLIIDADPGIGDALAIALALRDPSLDLIGVTAVPGCVNGQVATQNILSVVEVSDPAKRPRLGASSAPRPVFTLAGPGQYPPGFLDPLRLNGDYGLGESEVPFVELHNPHESARVLIDLVRNNPHEVTLLTLGPLTNVAVACELAPDFLDLLQRLVVMGGAVRTGGDVTAAAEFNIYADTVSAASVLLSPSTRTMLPLDIVNRVSLSYDQFDRLKQTRPFELKWFFDELLPFALRTHHEELGLEGLPLREVTALAAVAEPRFFDSSPMNLAIESAGHLTRGATVFDQRRIPRWQTNVDVVDEIDVQGVLDYVARVLQASG